MTSPGIIGHAALGLPFTLGIDTVSPLDVATLTAMRDHPVTPIRWVSVYLHAADAQQKRDACFAVGLPILPTTFSRAPGWVPSSNTGTQDGELDVSRLRAMGAPLTVGVATDLEGCSGTVQATELWANERGGVQKSAGFDPKLYCGAAQPLGGVELGHLIQDGYWQGLSRLVAPGSPPGDVIEPTQGWQIRQLPHTTLFCGREVDFDVIHYDWLGRLPMLWWPS